MTPPTEGENQALPAVEATELLQCSLSPIGTSRRSLPCTKLRRDPGSCGQSPRGYLIQPSALRSLSD